MVGILVREQETRRQKLELDSHLLKQDTEDRFKILKDMVEDLWTTDYKGENAYKK